MYIGLSLMNEKELAEITRLIGVEVPPSSPAVLFDIVSGWIAREVKKEGRAQEEVERCVLEWTAESWRIIVPSGTDTNDLERALRLKIAQEASEFLAPGWALCCGLIAVGKESNIQAKLDLMEEAASTAVPSGRARREKREQWDALCSRWSKSDPGEELQPYIDAIKERPELHTECLTLGLALSLLDGSIGFPTERLYRSICDQLEMSRGDSDEIKHKVNDLYWKHHNAALPVEADGKPSDPVRSAAQRTVYDAGALEALAAEARQQLFSDSEPEEKKKTGWSKLVGGLSGMKPFFSSKMKNDAHATLARVVYHTILKQHDSVVAAARNAYSGLQSVLSDSSERAAKPAAAPSPAAAPAEPASSKQPSLEENVESLSPQASEPSPFKAPAALSDQMVDSAKPHMKSIKLDLS